MLTGDNSILTKAGETKERTDIGKEREDISVVYTLLVGKEALNGEKITDIDFEEELNKNGDNTVVGYDDENNYLVYFNDTKRTYKVDKDGNITQLDNAPELITEKIYVTLYSNGTLAFSNINETDSTKTVIKTYTIEKNDWYDTPTDVPWNNETSSITKVIFVNKIRPTSTRRWFRSCTNLTLIENIQNLDTSQVRDTYGMFSLCNKLTTLDLRSFDTRRVMDMNCMFYGCEKLTNLDVTSFKTNNVRDMTNTFYNCKTLTSLNVSNFNTSNVTNMSYMFQNCSNLISLDLSNFNTRNVTNMSHMFQNCSNLTSLNLNNFETSNVTDMNNMFRNCKKLTSIDLSCFDIRNVTNMREMFCGWDDGYLILELRTIYVGDLWRVANGIDGYNMFANCQNIVGGSGTTYNSNKVDEEYARIDGGPSSSTPGYLTYKNIN